MGKKLSVDGEVKSFVVWLGIAVLFTAVFYVLGWLLIDNLELMPFWLFGLIFIPTIGFVRYLVMRFFWKGVKT